MDGTRPLMLGLVGDSASGKTTLVRGVVRLLGHNGVTPICLDDYHRYSRAELAALGLTAADPAANQLDLMADHLATLRVGGSIRKPVYDHRTGTLRGPETVLATGLVVAYGMLTLTPPSLADLFDLTIYLEPDEPMRSAWRLERDVRERGYTPEEVQARRAARERDAARFVAVQRPLAAMVARFHGAPGGDPAHLSAELLLRHGAGGGRFAPALDRLAAADLPGLTLERAVTDQDGLPVDRFLVDQQVSAPDAASLLAELLPATLPDTLARIGQVRVPDGVSQSPALALTQLLIVSALLRRA